MSATTNTERLIYDMLPSLITAGKQTVEPTYHSFIDELKDMTADDAPLDWDVIHAATDEFHGDAGQTRALLGELAARTTAIFNAVPGRLGQRRVRIHGNEGTFVACTPDGTIMASGHIHNPRVPAEYGIPDPWPFYKIAEAATLYTLGFNPTTNPGYGALKELKQSESPHLGHATMEQKSELVGICGTTGRTISSQFRKALRSRRPDIAARMTGAENHPDDLAGLSDTLSGRVVLSALAELAQGRIPEATTVTAVYLPRDVECYPHQDVDWN